MVLPFTFKDSVRLGFARDYDSDDTTSPTCIVVWGTPEFPVEALPLLVLVVFILPICIRRRKKMGAKRDGSMVGDFSAEVRPAKHQGNQRG